MRKFIGIGGSVLVVCLVGVSRDARAQVCASCLDLPWTGTCSSPTCLEITNTSSLGNVSSIEILTSNVGSVALMGQATSASSSASGVQGVNAATSGYGVLGAASDGDQTFGVGGINSADGTFTIAGTGYGSGVYGTSAGTTSVGVYGTSVGDTSYGVYGYNAQSASIGVFGYASGAGYSWGVSGVITGATTTGTTTGGVYGTTNASEGYGVAGLATASDGTGVYGTGIFGVAGVDDDGDAVWAQSSTGVAVYGSSSTGTGVAAGNGTTGISAAALVVENQNGDGSGVYAAYFVGNIQVTSGTPVCQDCTNFTNSSDARLKNDIQPLKGGPELLGRLRPVTFEWKDPDAMGHHGIQRGFIAQDVEKVIPEWVGEDGKGFKTLNLTGIEALTVATVQHLAKENADLEAEVESLETSRRPLISGVGEGGIGLLLLAMAKAALSRRKRTVDGVGPRSDAA